MGNWRQLVVHLLTGSVVSFGQLDNTTPRVHDPPPTCAHDVSRTGGRWAVRWILPSSVDIFIRWTRWQSYCIPAVVRSPQNRWWEVGACSQPFSSRGGAKSSRQYLEGHGQTTYPRFCCQLMTTFTTRQVAPEIGQSRESFK